ncbi:unnamed protein product [Alternaria alternata]
MSLYTAPLTTTKGEEAKTTPKRLLQTFQEVQAWQRDNEYLRNHYRSTTGSYRECLKSLSYLHNQTGNIYTHLIGAVVILSYGIYAYNSVSARYVTADINDLLAFGVFIGTPFITPGSNSIFTAYSS